MFEFCFKSVRNEKILLALQKKIVLVLLWDIINNKEVQQHMTNVITYIIIISFITFVNTFQAKKRRKTSFYSNQQRIIYFFYNNVLNTYLGSLLHLLYRVI